MKYWRFIILGAAVIILLVYSFALYRGNRQAGQTTGQTTQKWESQISEELPVLIKVTPTQLGKDADPWKFNMEFTTHSGNLDQDPAKVSILVDDSGKEYFSTAWEGAAPGGHHVSGTLTFKAITPLPEFVELKIKSVGGVSERSFKWNLQ